MTWGHGFRPCWFGVHGSRYVSLATLQHSNSHLTYISMSIDNNKNAGMTVVDLVTWLIVHRQPREILSLCRIGDVKKVEGLSEDTTVAALMDANANDFTLGSIMLHSLNAQSVNEVKSIGLSTFPYYSMKEELINCQAEMFDTWTPEPRLLPAFSAAVRKSPAGSRPNFKTAESVAMQTT